MSIPAKFDTSPLDELLAGAHRTPAEAIQAELNDSENTIRLDLTPSEKVELAMRIEQALEGRHGGDRKSSGQIWPLDQTQPETKK